MPSRELRIELVGDDASLSRAFKSAGRNSETLGSKLKGAAVTGAKALGGVLVAGAAAATYGIVKSTQAAEESNKVHAQTGAVLKSTGNSAGLSQKQIEGLAGSISRKTGIDDEAVQSGANLLLTFKDIKDAAGKGNDIFSQSTHTIVDMSAALDQDLKSSAIQVGKALNDPIKGLTALQRVGVSFSEQKAEQIKQWVEEGDKIRAQKAILKELNSEFGGSAEAQATAMDKVKVSLGNVEESLGNVFLPYISEGARTLNQDFVPELQHTADSLERIANRKNIDLGEKLTLSGDVLKRDWGDVPGEIGHLIDEAAPVVADHAGHLGVVWAEGMFHGFMQADPLGKAALLLFASKAFGGPAGLLSVGRSVGSRFGGAAASESTAAMAAGFGLSSAGTKAFGLIDRTRVIGKTVGKVGLGLGLLEGAQHAFEDPADGLTARLEQIDSSGKGLIPTIERALPDQLSKASDAIEGLVGHEDGTWAEQGDRAHRLLQILGQINQTHGQEHKLLQGEARSLADQLDLTKQQRAEVEHTLRAQTVASQSFKQGIHGLEGGEFTRLDDIDTVVQRNAHSIEEAMGHGTQAARDAAAKNFRAAAAAIQTGMDRGVISTKRGTEEISRLLHQAHLVSGDDPFGIARGFERSWQKAGKVTDQNLGQIQSALAKMPPASAAVAGQMMVSMAREMRQKGQLSKGEVERIRSAVVTKLDLMASQGGKKAGLFQSNVSGAFGGLSIDVAEALENIGVNVGQVMQQLGAKNQLGKFTLEYLHRNYPGAGKGAGKLVESLPEIGGAGKAGGGVVRVPGEGLEDSVPLFVNGGLSAVVAPGEDLVTFNRHQRPMVDEALAYRWGVNGLPGFFGAYDRPHYMARGGLHEPQLHGPDPLRSLGQAGIHKAFLAAQAYVDRQRPKTIAGGVAGYTGPPANMHQLGDAAWVDAHTLAVTAYLDSKFGLTMSSGYRSPQHNAEIGGAPGSLHTHGSPSNPGATDSVGSMGAMQAYIAFARQHVAGLEEAMVDNYAGLGSNAHLGFFDSGGLVVSGKASYEGGTGNSTADGRHTDEDPGFAIRDDATLGDWFWATVAGHSGLLQHTDWGPAEWTGREIDFTAAGLKKIGAPLSITDSPATVEWMGHTVDEAVKNMKSAGVAGGVNKKAPPASKQQKHTLTGLHHRAEGVLKDIRELKAEYKHHGGTDRGRRSLARAQKFAEAAAEEEQAGNSDNAKKLIDQARDEIGKARDSYKKAQENVYTPGLKPGALPGLGTDTYDPGQQFSPANLPGFDALPPEAVKLLKSPGLDWAGRYSVLETALGGAELTDTRADDAAALNAMLGMDREKRRHLKKELADLNRKLAKGGLTKKQRATLVQKRNEVLQGLGEVTGNIGSIRGQISGLNEPTEAEEEAKKLAEDQVRAAEELTATLKGLKDSIDLQNRMAESELAVGKAQLTRALADMLSGELGPIVDLKAQTAGAGTVGSL